MRQLTFPTELHTVPATPGWVEDVTLFLLRHPQARVRLQDDKWYLICPGDWVTEYVHQRIDTSQVERLPRECWGQVHH